MAWVEERFLGRGAQEVEPVEEEEQRQEVREGKWFEIQRSSSGRGVQVVLWWWLQQGPQV